MFIFSRKFTMGSEHLFPGMTAPKRESRHSQLKKNSEDIKKMMDEITERFNLESTKVFTEKDLIYHLYLNPISSFKEGDEDDIMNSPIAKKYFELGILTHGVSDTMQSQYRLTAFGYEQIKNALDLEMLS